jgi:hypothetical protein
MKKETIGCFLEKFMYYVKVTAHTVHDCDSPHWFDFEISEEQPSKDEIASPPHVDRNKEERYKVQGHFRRDGCTEFYGGAHLCGISSFTNMVSTYRAIPQLILMRWGVCIEEWDLEDYEV